MDQSFVTERLEATCRTFNALERQLADPSVAADPEQLLTLAKERSRLEPLVLDYQRLQQLDAEQQQADGGWRANTRENDTQATAMTLIVLQLPYRFLPILER